ncbi:glycoside hydrolase family 31 protein [Hufsiella ginkgonis]|nr:glycoside hydrolase family 31 protein [Hufsiella ginkgonis]
MTELTGNATHIAAEENKLIIETYGAKAEISIYGPEIIRIRISKRNAAPRESFAVIREPAALSPCHEEADAITLETGALTLRIDRFPLRFSFFNKNGQLLGADDPRFGTTWQGDRVITYRKLFPGEKFIGLGEKTGNLNRRGSNYVNWNTDAALHTPETDPLYKTFPFFIGIHDGLTYGLFFDNPHKSYFDFGATTDDQMSWFGADGGEMNYYFFGSASVAKILEDYTWLTGRMEMPPLWSLGYQQCRWSYMSAAEVLDVARKLRERQIPADVMYCDIDYMDNYKIFTWNKDTFADPKAMIDELASMGFKLVTIVDPGIKIEEGYLQYDEGIREKFFAAYPNGEEYVASVWPGRCHFPDFYREDVREWWGRSFAALTDPGVAGFWNDMNEPAAWGQNIPWLVQFGKFTLPEVRNAYGLEMSKATYLGTRKLLGNKRPFVLTRAAYSGIQRYSAVWTGDNAATDEHLLLGARLVNSLGLTGLSFIGVDIGGFMGDPTPGLMVRWNSLGPYIPMFRNHSAIMSKNREPWLWGEENERIIRKDIEQRYRLIPYIYACFYQSHTTGMPLARTLAIDHTHLEPVYDPRFQNQFLFGPSLLVAPVVSTVEETEVYLPPGTWYRLSTGERFAGDQVIMAAAPLADLPVFAKAGAIIPMQRVIQSTSFAGDGVLELHVWHGHEPSEFLYYEDDGDSYNYLDSDYYRRLLKFDPESNRIILGQAKGRFASRYREILLLLHGFGTHTPTTFTVKNDRQQILVTITK